MIVNMLIMKALSKVKPHVSGRSPVTSCGTMSALWIMGVLFSLIIYTPTSKVTEAVKILIAVSWFPRL